VFASPTTASFRQRFRADARAILRLAGQLSARGFGPTCVWVGLIAGLTACAALLNVRYFVISGRAVTAGSAATT